ncbi:Nuclear transport factor 2 [Frankliniella fusca]|uniref:Nuclear transport factor 2 n=1 Tax=Frankliniella fusca TaxID=407009 RepID=A0AAE1LQA9_9NEOP|nr:Nuclear transport factor 2 [Frankliniella fusca]
MPFAVKTSLSACSTFSCRCPALRAVKGDLLACRRKRQVLNLDTSVATTLTMKTLPSDGAVFNFHDFFSL